MYAFGLVETNFYKEAEKYALKVQFNPQGPVILKEFTPYLTKPRVKPFSVICLTLLHDLSWTISIKSIA